MKLDQQTWALVFPWLDKAQDVPAADLPAWIDRIVEQQPEIGIPLREVLAQTPLSDDDEFLEVPLHAPQDRQSQAGQPVGAYTIDTLLAEGGMGEVWLAHRSDGQFEGRFAVKLLHLDTPGAKALDRFKREGRLLARLTHPHIARLIDAGATRDGQPFLVLEYIDGEHIDRYCQARALSTRSRVRLFQDVLAAVAHAHTSLIIHRDIKPSNVLVTAGGIVKLLDFGIAKLIDPESTLEERGQLTRIEEVALTPSYAAPEQILGEPLSTATDVYQLGVLLHVLLAGCLPPGKGDSTRLERVKAAMEDTPVRISDAVSGPLRKELKGDLDAIIEKSLRTRPQERYATAAALSADLQRYLEHEPVTARSGLFAYKTGKFVRRHRFATAFVGMVTILSVLASAAALIAVKQKRAAEHQTAETLKAQARLLTQAAAQRLKNDDLAGAQGIILAVLTGSELAQSPSPAAISVFQEIRAADAQLAVLSGHGDPVASAHYSPDGTRIVTASFDATARIWDARTGAQLAVLGQGDSRHAGLYSAAYSPDGTHIVTASDDRTARLWDVRTGSQLAVLSGHGDRIRSAAYSPDGTHIVTASADKTARIWDGRTGTQLAVLSGHGAAVLAAAYSPDGMRIVTASMDKTARIWDAKTGAQLAVLSGHDGLVLSAAYSPDGMRIVTASADATARIWDSRTGAQLAVLSGHGDAFYSARYSPDGARIVTASQDKTARIWDAGTGAQLAVLSGHADIVLSADYSPDGGRIVTGSEDKTARVWDARTGAELAMLSGHSEPLNSAAYSPDGTRIVSTSQDKTARVWDARKGAQLGVLSGHAGFVLSAAYSADGTRIVTASADKTARVWDAETGVELAVLSGHGAAVESAAYSPDGTRIVTGSVDMTVRIWGARTGAELARLSGHADPLNSVAYSPDGTRIVTASTDKTARIWDAKTGAQLAVLSGHSAQLNSAAYSPDGNRVVTAANDKTARIWDAQTGAQITVLSGHGDLVLSAAYSPDGTRVVTASTDKTARIWDANTGGQLAVLRHGDFVASAAYSPDGTRIVTASDDKTARIWDAHVPASIAAQILWDEAAQTDPLPELDRTEFGLLPDAWVKQWGTEASACDQAAGAFYDPERLARGLAQAAIVADVANAACFRQIAASGNTPRLTYQAARALLAKSEVMGARQLLERAVAAGYRAAQVDLANLLMDASAGRLDPARAVALDQKAWQDGVPIAACLLGHFFETGVTGSTPDLTRAWEWYKKGADAGEPHAVARFAERAERQALTESDPEKTARLRLQAFSDYAAAAERAHDQDWPDEVWRDWRYRRATLARILASQGMMQQVADAYAEVLARTRK
jgi:WD40 repeat protein/TPR repeat protein